MSSLPFVFLATAVAAFGFQLVTWVVSLRLRRASVVDATWGPSFALVAVVAFAVSSGEGDPARRLLLLALTVIWGMRLGIHIGWRQRGSSEDPRYADLLARSGGATPWNSLRMVFLLQAGLAWFISWPIQVAMCDRGALLTGGALGPLAWLGLAFWVVGFYFETVGDWQLSRFRADPANRGTVLKTGLWRYTRHPNYFGDACLWWGLFLISADAGWAWLTLASPLLMTWFLAAKTGKPLMEQQLSGTRPGYAEYVQRTSGFIPWPPKRAAKV